MGSSQPLIDQLIPLAAARAQQREPAWLQQLRADAWQRFSAAGVPTKRLESWHYSPADFWLQQYSEQHTLAPIAAAADASTGVTLPGGHRVRFSHGQLVEQQLDSVDGERLSLQPLAQLDDADRDALGAWLAERRPADAFADLATALSPESWVLTIRAGQQLERPVIISQLASAAGAQISHLIIWVQPGARGTVVECFGAVADDYLHLANSSLRLERDAHLTYMRLQREAPAAQHLGVVDADVGQNAELRLQTLVGGEPVADERSRIRNGFYVDLNQPGANFTARGAFAADARQHVDYHFTVNHNADHGRSDILVQGLADEQSSGIVNGRIHIAANTRGNDGHFTSHNLLLSAEAQINAKPELEIYADEVSCSHGATIGQLDELQLFYLLSRGIGREDAINLLKEGFLKAGLLESGDAELDRFLKHELLARVGIDIDNEHGRAE